MNQQETFMQRCLQLAEKGLGQTGSNPLVGAVVVHNNRIIGEGYHRSFGGPHAEVLAIESVRNKDLLRASTLYVNLEPCSHHGKTPPCTDLIMASNIPHIVVGTVDPSSKVKGKGIDRLRRSGCQVDLGVLAPESQSMNRRFFTYHEKMRPYIILKWAESSDGYIDIIRKPEDPIGPNWISGPLERILVHQWRSQEQGLLVGSTTVRTDDPALDVRLWPGRSPIRMVIDKDLKIDTHHKIYNREQKTIVFNSKKMEVDQTIHFVALDFSGSVWPQIMKFLYEEEMVSIMVEGGAKTLQSLIDAALWDEARVFRGSQLFKAGVPAPRIIGQQPSLYKTWDTWLEMYQNNLDISINRPFHQIIQ